MKISKLFLSVSLSMLLAVPLLASAAVTPAEHPAPPLPPGAKVGVVSSIIASSTPAPEAGAANPAPAGTANTPGPVGSFNYVVAGIIALLALVLGFFLGKRNN